MVMKITVLDKPIERSREACDLARYDLEQRVPRLGDVPWRVADGEHDEGRR